MKQCEWVIDCNGLDIFYKTECGNAQYFSEGDIKDNKYRYCPYCGFWIKDRENNKG